jgi:serine/threonine protein kinase
MFYSFPIPFLLQMLEAVNTIHEERIVHTDLKPANFLFVKGVLKLIDFGIAKAISDDTTNIHRENQVGTLNYISPEALIDTSGKKSSLGNKNGMDMKLGRSSDIWSLGCILYQMVYGKTPFAELGLVQKLQAIVSEEYNIPYPTVDPMYDNAIDVIKLCLQRNSKQRPGIMGTNGLLDHLFLHPERKQASSSTHDATGNSALALDNLSLIKAMQHCFSSAENTNSEDNMEQFKLLVNTILTTGQEMERQHMQGPGLRGTVADNIVDQLQQALDMSTMDGGSGGGGGGALVFDGTKAVRHAKDVALRAQKMSTMSGKSGGNKMARPVRKMDFIGQLKKKKSVLNKAPKQQKAKQMESTGLKAVLEQGFASRFAKANLNRANEDCTLGNWTVSDDF